MRSREGQGAGRAALCEFHQIAVCKEKKCFQCNIPGREPCQKPDATQDKNVPETSLFSHGPYNLTCGRVLFVEAACP